MILNKLVKSKIENPYKPYLARIIEIFRETNTIKTFKFKFLDKNLKDSFMFTPGQFIQVSVFGTGEIPLTICSSPFYTKFFQISVRRVGNVTNALFDLKKGDIIGIRGPYGNGYPINQLMYKDIVLVAGGIGFPPIKSLIEYILHRRDNFGHLWLLYGARNPEDIVFKKELIKWKKEKDFNILITVDKAIPGWKGNVGVVTNLFDKVKIHNKNTVGITCGPPIMMKFVTQEFKTLGFKDDQIYLSMERLMHCGIGKCGHCNIGKKYVCKDGPVFRYDELKELTEKLW